MRCAAPVRARFEGWFTLSGGSALDYGTVTGPLLVPFLTSTAWIAACARRHDGDPPEADGHLFAGLAGLLLVIVLGVVVGFLIAIGHAIF
ncbi:hypothetical protein [Streptomyces sp. ICC1]|uniref:hypothetical protein n=1 Tax=Streptomyces sp. ICC1 TaxID=2099583 RepID=UPI000DC7A5B0|nr:hypothetical protein [Streptomyces sp. ICC1]AWZ12815.1 hypothetical protein DRB96_11275 [Streptomyces sp. ICC1]